MFCACVAVGQDYPHKPIRIYTGNAGGGVDFAARLLAQGLTSSLGQQVIVDNRPGNLPPELVAKAQPDGYSLLVVSDRLWIGPLMQKMAYDPVNDFAPITIAVKAPNILVVHPSLPVKSVKELIALAKRRPGDLNYSSGGNGTPSHLATELFKSLAGVDMLHIPHRGSGPALTSLVGGHVQLTFGSAGAMAPHTRSGRLRALAVTSPRPSAMFPELPTVAASGVPGYEFEASYGILAPAKTPDAIISRLNQVLVKFLSTPEARAKFSSTGVEAVGGSPREFASAMKAEMNRMGKVIREAGIRAD